MNTLHIANMLTWANVCGAPPGIKSYYATVKNFRGFLAQEHPASNQFVCCTACIDMLPMLLLAETEL